VSAVTPAVAPAVARERGIEKEFSVLAVLKHLEISLSVTVVFGVRNVPTWNMLKSKSF